MLFVLQAEHDASVKKTDQNKEITDPLTHTVGSNAHHDFCGAVVERRQVLSIGTYACGTQGCTHVGEHLDALADCLLCWPRIRLLVTQSAAKPQQKTPPKLKKQPNGHVDSAILENGLAVTTGRVTRSEAI